MYVCMYVCMYVLFACMYASMYRVCVCVNIKCFGGFCSWFWFVCCFFFLHDIVLFIICPSIMARCFRINHSKNFGLVHSSTCVISVCLSFGCLNFETRILAISSSSLFFIHMSNIWVYVFRHVRLSV